jgi:ADP-L-glycero-D-manno-heptose 6-epimerase
MILVTGGAGFVGSNVCRAIAAQLNADITVIDDLDRPAKIGNIEGIPLAELVGRAEFARMLDQHTQWLNGVEAVIHLAASTDTRCDDEGYMRAVNTQFSMLLLDACIVRRVPFIYASSSAVYGASGRFTEDPANEMPVSAYARSKAYFDQHVRNILADIRSPVTGLRFFNVYGLGEEHKGPMASVVYQMHEQARQNGKVEVFADLPGCADGEQQRDLITIGDVVRVTLWFLTQASKPGIYNVGTGVAVSFNDIAELVLAHRGGGTIDYVPLPVRLRETYQTLTKADLRALREAGYPHVMTSPDAGIRAYLQQLSPPA